LLNAPPCRPKRPGSAGTGFGDRWYVDETYVKVAGRWVYLYRAVDQFGQVIDVYASARRTARRRASSSSEPRRPPV
jgi:transposase, IS6 family